MNRRGFLGTLLALPAVGIAAKAADFSQPKQKIIMSSMYGTLGHHDYFEILTPYEIATHFHYVSQPVFTIKGVQYVMKTRRLKVRIQTHELTFHRVREAVAEQAIAEIKREHEAYMRMGGPKLIDRPYITSVRLFESPVICSPDNTFYCGYMRGARVREMC